MFAKNLKEIMTAKKISGARLARETGYSKAAISQYMNGINVPSPERIEAIAGALVTPRAGVWIEIGKAL